MKMLSVASCSALVVGAIAAATAAPPASKPNPLRVSLLAAPAVDGALGAVEVTITNTSRHTVRLPKWELPSNMLEAKLFQVSREGEPVRYQGLMVKRGLPQAADFAIIRAGETVRTVVDLSNAYDMSKSGNYVVTLASPMHFASLSSGESLKHANGLPMQIRSVPLQLWVDGAEAKGGGGQVERKPASGATVVNGVSYVGCEATQITDAGAAVAEARKYSENAKGYLAGGATGPRYTTWFGAYTSARYTTMNQHFVSIDSAMDQSSGQIKINCGCNTTSYAYVYPARPYEIFVCRSFWNAPLVGTDSKAGTLIHEMSHFDAVAATDDVAYGQTNAKALATSDPASAVRNADSHEYFAENNPFQN